MTSQKDHEEFLREQRSKIDRELSSVLVPPLSKDVTGQCYGGAFWSEADYRVTMARGEGGSISLNVEDSGGALVARTLFFDEELIEGIDKVAHTDHGLSGYEDDWKIPAGMGRVLTWTLQTDINHEVVLNEADIDEVAAWLEYAIGEKVWDGGEDWEF